MKTFTASLLSGALAIAGALVFFHGNDRSLAADQSLAGGELQGVWSGARFDSGAGENPAAGVKLELTFQGNHVKARRLPDGGDIGEGEFTLSADGKTIDAIGVSKNYRGNLYLGVIKVEGDTLYWCTTSGAGGKTQTRPEKFTADPAQRTYLIVVKRQK